MFNNFFPKITLLCEIMSKNWAETEGPQMTSQYGAYALSAGLAKLQARMRNYTPTRPSTRMHAHACTHRPIFNTYCFSTATMVSWTSLNITLYVHCLYCYGMSQGMYEFDRLSSLLGAALKMFPCVSCNSMTWYAQPHLSWRTHHD